MPHILFTADLHGDVALYRGLFARALQRNVDAVVLGGDLFPHATRQADALDVQKRFVAAELHPLLRQLQADRPVTVAAIPGNDDWAAAVATLEPLAAEGLLTLIHNQTVPLGDVWLAGYGNVPVTPFSIKDYERRDLPEDVANPAFFARAYRSDTGELRLIEAAELNAQPSIADDLAALAQSSPLDKTVYVIHTPPYGSDLDVGHGRRHLGSRAVTRFLEQQQPAFSLHGHIHESPALSGAWHQRFGNTLAINAGRDGRRLCAVWLDTDTGQTELEW